MNQNFCILYEDHNSELPPQNVGLDQLLPENCGEGDIQRQPPATRPLEYYKGYANITYFDILLVLPPLPHGNTFVVTSSLM